MRFHLFVPPYSSHHCSHEFRFKVQFHLLPTGATLISAHWLGMSIRLLAVNIRRRLSSLRRETSCTFPSIRTQFSVAHTFCRTPSLQSHTVNRTPSALFPNCSKPSCSFSSSTSDDDVELPPPPTDCCMSGCANCVWLSYAEELAQIYKDGGRAAERVLEAIEDPSLKIFLSLELRQKLKG